MRIHFVSTIGSPWGGSEVLWSEAAIRLAEKGHSVSLSFRNWGSLQHAALDNMAAKGIKLSLWKPRIRFLLSKARAHGIRYLNIRSDVERSILKIRPDLVVFSQASCFGAYQEMLFCLKFGIPYCSVSQLNTEVTWPTDQNHQAITDAFQNARAVFFVSNGNLRLFETQIAETLQNARIVSNPLPNVTPGLLEWPDQTVLRFAHVARIQFNHKGTDILLRVFSEPQWKNRKFEINIYGTGSQIKLATKLARHIGTHNVLFHGYEKNVQDIWARNHALVLSSRYEGMPLALLEAMSCGRPAVVTDIASLGEMIINEKTGYLAEAATEKHFSNALERAWLGRAGLKQLGVNAYEHSKASIPSDPIQNFVDHILSFLPS